LCSFVFRYVPEYADKEYEDLFFGFWKSYSRKQDTLNLLPSINDFNVEDSSDSGTGFACPDDAFCNQGDCEDSIARCYDGKYFGKQCEKHQDANGKWVSDNCKTLFAITSDVNKKKQK
jgi:hypothetical protein